MNIRTFNFLKVKSALKESTHNRNSNITSTKVAHSNSDTLTL